MIFNWTPKLTISHDGTLDYGVVIDGVYYGSHTELYSALSRALEGCLEANPTNTYLSVGRVLAKEQKEYLGSLCDKLEDDIKAFRKRLDCY